MRYWDLLVQGLLRDPALKLADRSLYLLIYEWQPEGMRELERIAGTSRTSLRASCQRLIKARWLRLDKVGQAGAQLRPVALVPAECQAIQLQHLLIEQDMAVNRGELLMRRQLDLRVRDRAFVDNARPPQFEQPTGSRLECDRLYIKAGVVFEYLGKYHHDPPEGATEAETKEHIDTQMRDLIKLGLSHQAGIKLVRVTGVDLRFDTFAKLIPDSMPLRRLDPGCLYYRELARQCESYASYAKRRMQEQVRGSRRAV